MAWNVVITAFVSVVVYQLAAAAPPMRLTIDCGSERGSRTNLMKSRSEASPSRFDMGSFCQLIQNAIPKAVKDGRFVLVDRDDQETYADTQVPLAVAPPILADLGLTRFRVPRLKIPKISVPILKPIQTPFRGLTSQSAVREEEPEEEGESSAERMERFKKGVQKLLHVVKVLGLLDQYLSERTRIVIDKLSKTFAE